MLLQKEPGHGTIKIKGYQPGKINISGQIYHQAIVLTPSQLSIFEQTNNFVEFKIEDLLTLITDKTEIIIIGCGEKHQFLAAVEIKKINDLGIAIEVMATRQACHTFQVLSYESRQVMALLFP